MERSYIQFNLANWITVVIMVALGTAVLGALSSAIKAYIIPRAGQ